MARWVSPKAPLYTPPHAVSHDTRGVPKQELAAVAKSRGSLGREWAVNLVAIPLPASSMEGDSMEGPG